MEGALALGIDVTHESKSPQRDRGWTHDNASPLRSSHVLSTRKPEIGRCKWM